jgi:hypothetical protein
VNAAGVRRLARRGEIADGIPVGEVGCGVEAADGVAGDSGELGLAFGGFAGGSGHGEEFTVFGFELPVEEKKVISDQISVIRRQGFELSVLIFQFRRREKRRTKGRGTVTQSSQRKAHRGHGGRAGRRKRKRDDNTEFTETGTQRAQS